MQALCGLTTLVAIATCLPRDRVTMRALHTRVVLSWPLHLLAYARGASALTVCRNGTYATVAQIGEKGKCESVFLNFSTWHTTFGLTAYAASAPEDRTPRQPSHHLSQRYPVMPGGVLQENERLLTTHVPDLSRSIGSAVPLRTCPGPRHTTDVQQHNLCEHQRTWQQRLA